MNKLRYTVFALLVVSFIGQIVGCGGSPSGSEQLLINIENLGQLSGNFTYAIWVQTSTQTNRLQTFNTDVNDSVTFSRRSTVGNIVIGDRFFVTIEPSPSQNPNQPSGTIVLDGNVSDNTAILNFPRLQEFANAQGFTTVSGAGNRQLLTDFTNLPDVSSLNFIYQGFLLVGNNFVPLRTFNFNQVPVSDTVNFDLTTAQYFLSIEPVPDFDPDEPYTIRPFFTNGNLQQLERQSLVRSSLTPGSPNFRFPSGVVTIR